VSKEVGQQIVKSFFAPRKKKQKTVQAQVQSIWEGAAATSGPDFVFDFTITPHKSPPTKRLAPEFGSSPLPSLSYVNL